MTSALHSSVSLASAVERQMFEEYVTRAKRTGEAKENLFERSEIEDS